MVNIAVLGYGTVGSGVVEVVNTNGSRISQRIGDELNIKYVLDLKEEFIQDYVYPTVKAGAVYENKYPLGTSFARPIIAKGIVEIAKKEGADAICHGCTGKGNDLSLIHI